MQTQPSPASSKNSLSVGSLQVSGERTGMDKESLSRAFFEHLFYSAGTDKADAKLRDYYVALSNVVRDRLLQRWKKTEETYIAEAAKTVCYLSAEFLMGRYLGNNMISLGIYETVAEMLADNGIKLEDVLEEEVDPGLGNGGLGRLAACFLDSLACLEVPAIGYGIRYEFGIFHQYIRNGWQVEVPDKWLRNGNPWEICRQNDALEIPFGGHTEMYHSEKGHPCTVWVPNRRVKALPYDTPVPGYNNNTVNVLRLWSASASEDEGFDFEAFNAGDYDGAVASQISSENISKVLYPNDNTPQGRQLRLEQQFFFVSASLQDMIRSHLKKQPTLDNFFDFYTVQLNDTHPAIAVAELMRLFVDEHNVPWERAWFITQKTLAYTNHTLMPEALERWPVEMFEHLLPRHLEIIYEINFRFIENLKTWYSGEGDLEKLISELSIIEEFPQKSIRMANLACIGSHAINGVAALHTELLKSDTLQGFARIWPEKFFNKTNGVTPRRWIRQCNPKLTALISSKIGDQWIKNLEQVQKIEEFIDDPEFRKEWAAIKYANKVKLAEYIKQKNGVEVDPNSIFDIQVKRIHEYKRQLLDVLYIITLYNRIKSNPSIEMVPRTMIFGGKAAPGYFMAKLIIKLVNAVAEVVNNDPQCGSRLKVIFLENFNVSLGQKIYPAANLSEQISTAGKEASGTGNMKFAMNGALTIGTLDGANIEIREEVGADNFFLFGMTADEVYSLKASGYNSMHYYQTNSELKEVIDRIARGDFSHGDTEMFKPIVDSLLHSDQYVLLADFASYVQCQEKVSAAYQDQDKWTRMSILNAARVGKFSSDRTIDEYVREIWDAKAVPVSL
ncbi:glycogen/starch/alpha-glucan phosphorylase [[Limnothrix rosea] IAM M-220]|uniref:glycogen/starch/alpha-glucan phosphorylase n=1 Tax=[Limnothrix rosea] IAM M-220 TaxID=454133 RepID=UPI00095B5D10|nr:glycogen/starch/alpha-glucan phosphorylase [[Limnothrix rosea] IAM M-220]OKH19534.1 glycogen phosphorylase [[Limnothrix rosea] IAM M-220]